MSSFAALTPLISPRSVAIIGASDERARIGGRPIDYMLGAKFAGEIFPVNPKRDTVQGLKAYPSVNDLPRVPDVAIIAVPPVHAIPAIADLARRGTRATIVFTAGFAETGEAGARLQAEMLAAAKPSGMRLLGPNCLGLFNARIGFYPTFTASLEGGYPKTGRIGIASQSGAYGTHLFVVFRERGIGTPICITTGNESDVTVGEAIGWLAEDPDTDVIAVYAEGIRESAQFLAALAAAKAARKPVVLMKVGRSSLGEAAAKSHTASIAGDDAVTEAVMREFGVVRARTTEEMVDIAYAATRRIYPVGNTLGVITVSGGAGVLISDAAEALGLPMPAMPEAAQRRLLGFVPFCAPRNPVDCTAHVLNQTDLIGEFAEATIADGGYKSVLAFFSQTGNSPTISPVLRRELAAVKARHPDRLYVLSVLASQDKLREYDSDGWLVFEDPTRAVVAIEAMGRFGTAFADGARAAPPTLPAFTLPATTPSEAVAKTLLSDLGMPSAPERACATADAAVAAAAEFGFPVVVKILSPDILHKTEIGGVLLNLADAAAVGAAFETVLERARHAAPAARIDGVLVAKQLSGGTECILGIHRDPVFGPIAMFGAGGIFVEVLRDVVFRRCPFGEDVAAEMIRSIRTAPLLLGVRGRPPADVAALARMLSRLSVFAADAGPRLQSVDLNPVFAMPDGQGAFAADAVIEIGA